MKRRRTRLDKHKNQITLSAPKWMNEWIIQNEIFFDSIMILIQFYDRLSNRRENKIKMIVLVSVETDEGREKESAKAMKTKLSNSHNIQTIYKRFLQRNYAEKFFFQRKKKWEVKKRTEWRKHELFGIFTLNTPDERMHR